MSTEKQPIGKSGRERITLWRPISWRARKTHVTRDVGAQACVKTLTMIFANVRADFVRAFIIKNALLETGHVSRSQTVCLVSKRYIGDPGSQIRPKFSNSKK